MVESKLTYCDTKLSNIAGAEQGGLVHSGHIKRSTVDTWMTTVDHSYNKPMVHSGHPGGHCGSVLGLPQAYI